MNRFGQFGQGLKLLLVGGDESVQLQLEALTLTQRGGVCISRLPWRNPLRFDGVPEHVDAAVISLHDRTPGWARSLDSAPSSLSAVPVIMIGAASDHRLAVEGFRAGAGGWLVPGDTDPSTVPQIFIDAAAELSQQPVPRCSEAVHRSWRETDPDSTRKAYSALQREKERLRITLASIGDAVITTDEREQVDYLNPTAEALTGWSTTEAIGKPLTTVFRTSGRSTAEMIEAPLDVDNLGTSPVSLLLRQRIQDRTVVVELTSAPIKTADGQLFGHVLVFRDVTEARKQSERIAYQANHDSLTGLLNRRAFEDRLKSVIEQRCAGQLDSHVLCFLDLDRFKIVNDSCGHAAGDELLCEITAIIRATLRNRDTLARLGGDEFAILLEHCPMSVARQIGEQIREAVADYRYRCGERVFSLGVSIGLAAINKATDTVESILQAADSACYAAKDAGRNRVHEYHSDDGALQRRQQDNLWIPRLSYSLDNDRFELYAQGIEPTDGRSDCGVHLEVLLRLREQDGSLVPPGVFIPIAERFQIMHRLDRWVIGQALNWLADHRQDLPELDSFGINLSGQSLNEPQFLPFVESRLDSTGVPGDKICFEITETAAINNVQGALSVMDSLSARGCRFALDDFGSGLSSFAYLRSLPVDYLKIDGLFVRDILEDKIDLAMVRTINDIGQLLGKQTIAEYVENTAIRDRLLEIGVDWVQGFGVSRPTPLPEFWALQVATRSEATTAQARQAG